MLSPRIYRWISRLALPLTRLYLRKRARKQPAYLEHWDERYGKCDYPKFDRPCLWVHAVSVGETYAARPLIVAALKAFPECEILLTSMTPTGRDVGAKLIEQLGSRLRQCYLPYDTPELMERFLEQVRPRLGLIMETEVWPNLMEQARRRGIPMVLANARESEKSFRQAQRFLSVMRPAFASFSAVLAQSEEDARRLCELGAKNIRVCGSVKFDMKSDVAQVQFARQSREKLGRPVILLASTRQDEERMFLESIATLPGNELVSLVPRHPQRFDEVAELLEKSGIAFVRRSCTPEMGGIAPSVRVILGDTMGEMGMQCAFADVCIMGGSFGNFGCQNLIEPAANGVPVIVGPSTFNFAKPVEDALACGGASQVRDANEAMRMALQWLTDGSLASRRQKALAFANQYTGATERMMREICALWSVK